jgi:hypothetical protein
MSHTPGPWEQDPTGDLAWWFIGTADKVVCECVESDELTDLAPSESKANARLIAAAPDLLAALRDLLSDAASSGDPAIAEAIVANAYAAIAKAEDK